MTDGNPSATADSPRDFKRAVETFLLILVLGPPIGGCVALGPLFLSSSKPFQSVVDFVSAIGGVVMLGYVFGVWRAGLAGAWIGYRVWARGSVGYLECLAAALVATLLGAAYLLAVVGLDGWAAVLTLNAVLCVAAVVAALACRWIAGVAGLLH